MKIVHVIHSGAIGGGPSVLTECVAAARQRGFENSVICGADGPLAAALEQQGVPTRVLRHAGKWSFARSVLPLARVLQADHVDVVLLYGQFAGFYGAMASRLVGVPAIYEAHFPSFVTDAGPISRLRNHLAEWVSCRLARVTTVVSEADRSEYLRRRLQTANRLFLVPNGVRRSGATPEDSQALRVKLLGRGRFLLLAAGRMEHQKGFDVLLKAMPAVVESIPDVRLALIGEGPGRRTLEALIIQLGLSGIVMMYDFQRPLDRWLYAADVVVVPSRYEPGGLVAREAMAAGCPVVASNVQGLAETILHGTTGLLVPPDDPQRLADTLKGLLSDPELRERFGAAARVAAESFSREAMWAGYEHVIGQL